MPRGRIVRPEFWNDEKLSRTGPGTQLVYIATWNLSDDYGVVKGDSTWLLHQVFPYGTIKLKQFEGWLRALVELRRLIPFEVNGEAFYYNPKFLDHQTIKKPSQTRNPKPPNNIESSTPPVENQYPTSGEPVLPEVEVEREVEVKEKRKGTPAPKFGFDEYLNMAEGRAKIIKLAAVAKDDQTYTGQFGVATDVWLRFQIKKIRLWILGKDEVITKTARGWGQFVSGWFKRAITAKEEAPSDFHPYEGHMTAAEEDAYYKAKRRTGPNSDFKPIGSNL